MTHTLKPNIVKLKIQLLNCTINKITYLFSIDNFLYFYLIYISVIFSKTKRDYILTLKMINLYDLRQNLKQNLLVFYIIYIFQI